MNAAVSAFLFVRESETLRILASSCQWLFPSFSLASSLLNSSFYFNHSGTLTSSAVVSYDITNIDKKLNLFALQQKIEFGLCKKLENFVITKTLKMPTAFCQATKSSVSFILTATLRWVILSLELYQLTLLIGYTKHFACLICKRGFKNEKEARIILAGANQKAYATSCVLLYTNYCERNLFLFCIKKLSKFSVQMLRDVCLLFVKTVVVFIINSTVVPLYTLHKCIVTA